MIKRWIGLALIFITAVGCQAAPPDIASITPAPTTQVVRVLLSPEVRPVEGALQACSADLPGISLHLTDIPPGQSQVLPGDILIQLGYAPNPELFNIPLAEETFSVIAHTDFPLTTLTADDLRAAYQGEIRSWEDFGLTTAASQPAPVFWTYPPGHPLVQAVFQPMLAIPANLPPALRLAPDSSAMQQAVLDTNGALGFIPNAWVTSDIKQISIEDGLRLPSLPILATTLETPEGAAKSFLACLQSPLGQGFLEQFYEPWAEN